jgi:hypothetical protein
MYTGVSGLTLTGVVRGLALYGTNTSGGVGTAHAAGTDIANRDVHYYYAQFYDYLVGTSSTGTNTLRHGDGNTISSSNRFMYFHTSSLSAFFGLSSDGTMVASQNGVTAAPFGASFNVSSFTGGEGITIATTAINGPSVRVKARQLGGHTYNNPLTFDTQDFDIYGEMTSASFTPASNGIYQIICSITNSNNVYGHGLYMNVDGVSTVGVYVESHDATFGTTATLNELVQLSANQVVTFNSWMGSFSSGINGNPGYCPRLEIIKYI